MTVTVSTMFIPVHDPDDALGFYRDALDLEVRNDVAGRYLARTESRHGIAEVRPSRVAARYLG